jgi:hypothetical protein
MAALPDSPFRYRYQMYRHLHASIPSIFADARAAADDIGLPPELRGQIGLTGSISSCHALLRRDVQSAMEVAARKVIENKFLVEDIRELVKDYYGDSYDAVAVNTCEAALGLCFDALATPPLAGRGESYRTRYVAPYERHAHHHAGYGRPFPAHYKDLYADRGVTAGELGIAGKRLTDLDVVLARLKGAKYDCHGIKYFPATLLLGTDAIASAEHISQVAARHQDSLSAFASMGYDTPGYGYAERDANGAPLLMAKIGELAAAYDVPYIVDNAKGVPFLGIDPRDIGASVVLYSMDKASGAPTGGLIIGHEEYIVPLRRALGMHGERNGAPLSYGKAGYVGMDGGKEYLVGLIAALRAISSDPDVINGPLTRMYDIVVEEFDRLAPELRQGIDITKSTNGATVEINYERTWADGFGIPIFTIEDMYAGTSLFQSALAQMGILPAVAYDANIMITPGLGTTDEDGELLEEPMRLAVRGLVRLIEIVCTYAGVFNYAKVAA